MRTMSITIDERLYRMLKRTAGPRGMSRFISRAVRGQLRGSRAKLYEEYLAASEDPDRGKTLADWDAVETEGWR